MKYISRHIDAQLLEMKRLHQFMTNKNLHKAVRCSLEKFGSISDQIVIIPIYAISNI